MLDFDSDEVRRGTGYNVAAGLDVQLAKRHSLGFTGRAIFNQNDNVLESTTGITLPGSTAKPGLQTCSKQYYFLYLNCNYSASW